MNDDQAALAEFQGEVRLFPLPNLVLFPHVVQGLHIFEPRYRQMLMDALAGDRLLALALLLPGWEEEYDSTPSIEPVACLGRIGWHESLPDGRFNLRLRGIARVGLTEELPTDRLYRIARAELIPDVLPAEIQRLKTLRKLLADTVLPRFAGDATAHLQLHELFESDESLGHVCDVLSYALPMPIDLKQALLAEPHVDLRAEIIIQAMNVSAARADRTFPPSFSNN